VGGTESIVGVDISQEGAGRLSRRREGTHGVPGGADVVMAVHGQLYSADAHPRLEWAHGSALRVQVAVELALTVRLQREEVA
jgi:hypothetical protein